MRLLFFFTLAFLSGNIFGQKPNVAVIVEEHTDKFDMIFYCKVGLLIVLGIIAISTYLKFHRQENSQE